MVARRRVCFVTATRAEYGLLRPLMQWVGAEVSLERQVIVTGAHLSSDFGSTWRPIEADGIAIDEKVEILNSSDSAAGVSHSMGMALMGIGSALERLRPHLLVLLGDRYEMVSAASAAMVHNVPVAHIHGGEVTEGAIDDGFRHAITKMAHLHFTSTASYRHRVIQLGEHPDRVFDVGAIGLDSVHGVPLIDRASLSASLGADLSGPFFLVTYHPETVDANDPSHELDVLMHALLGIEGHKVLVTGANADVGGRQINERLAWWQAAHPERIVFCASLGQQRYLSAMKMAQAVVGNSSSGIIEAPSMHVPTIDIGRRQHGRVRAASVLNVPMVEEDVRQALRQVTGAPFRAGLGTVSNPYGNGGTTERIGRVIVAQLEQGLSFRKSFFDLTVPSLCSNQEHP